MRPWWPESDRAARIDRARGSDAPRSHVVGRGVRVHRVDELRVRIGVPVCLTTELPRRVTLAIGMPANERMDALVEKATELGVAAVQPLICERSVLVLHGERAERKRAHWQGVAQAACEQCGRAVVPRIEAVRTLRHWLTSDAACAPASARHVLSLRHDATPWAAASVAAPTAQTVLLLSGPEGGLSPAEEDSARAAGFTPVSLGNRVLRADTAPLAALAYTMLMR